MSRTVRRPPPKKRRTAKDARVRKCGRDRGRE